MFKKNNIFTAIILHPLTASFLRGQTHLILDYKQLNPRTHSLAEQPLSERWTLTLSCVSSRH